MLSYFVLKIEGTQWLCVVLCINCLKRYLGRGRRGIIKIKRGTERQPREEDKRMHKHLFVYSESIF